ncbi:MAG: hypothetical protein Tsb0019_10300 [Roseibium sp.]
MKLTKTLVALASLAAAASLAPATASAGEITLTVPFEGATLHSDGLDMSVYFTQTGANAWDVVALYVTGDAPAEPQRLQMHLLEGDSVSFSLPGQMQTLYSFARTGNGVSITSQPARPHAAM